MAIENEEAAEAKDEKSEIINTPVEAKTQLMTLIFEEAMKTVAVQNFVKGLAMGLNLKGGYILRYEDLNFIKNKHDN